jgi:hypothetical protein
MKGDLGARRLSRFESGRAEVDEHRTAVVRNEDVRRFDITMQDTHSMRPV